MSSVESVYSSNNEEFFEDIMDAIGQFDDPAPGMTIYVGDKKSPDVTTFIGADDVIEAMNNAAIGFGGEYAEDFPEVSDEEKAELDAFLKAWALKHCKARFYQVENIRKTELTQEDIDAYNGQ